jgi:hypothetical protein
MKAFFKSICNFIKEALSEDVNQPSAIRLLIFIGYIQWSIVITFGFVWVLMYYPYLIIGYLASLVSLITFLFGLKVYQRIKGENSQ